MSARRFIERLADRLLGPDTPEVQRFGVKTGEQPEEVTPPMTSPRVRKALGIALLVVLVAAFGALVVVPIVEMFL